MINKIFNFLKILIINFFIFLTVLIIFDLIFGNWFNNNFKTRLASERNIDRVYKFNFENYSGTSHYIRGNLGFRINKEETVPEKINVIFVGGSTANQKFLNYEDTLVGLLQKKFENINLINAGIDGMSIVGHINSFEYWFDKINNLSPDYYIYYIGVNDERLFIEETMKPVDSFIESNFYNNIKQYLEANSFIYNKKREIQSILYLKFGLSIGVQSVNAKTVVYGKRSNLDVPPNTFTTYEEFLSTNLTPPEDEIVRVTTTGVEKWYHLLVPMDSHIKERNWQKNIYLKLLNKLTDKVTRRNAEPIYITQITGLGMNTNLLLISDTIMKHCRDENLYCLNMAAELDLNYDDFFDRLHLNPVGSKKVSEYLFEKLSTKLNKKG